MKTVLSVQELARKTASLARTGARMSVSALVIAGCLAAPPAQALSPADITVMDRVEVKQMIIDEAKNSLVPVPLALALAKVESDFQTNARSTTGAVGVMQIMPENAIVDLGIDPAELWEPKLNVQVGLDRLGRLYQQYGTWELALAHYHAGSVDGIGNDAKPRVTSQAYVDAVLRWRDRYAAQGAVWAELYEREQAWFPSHTLVDEVAVKRPELTIAAPQKAVADRARDRAPAIVIWRDTNNIDDFLTVDQRRAEARMWLDDFAPRSRTPEGH
jgi:hypothetical protein